MAPIVWCVKNDDGWEQWLKTSLIQETRVGKIHFPLPWKKHMLVGKFHYKFAHKGLDCSTLNL